MGEKTEKPTAQRLSKARKKGSIAFSRELVSSIELLVSFFLLGTLGTQIMQSISNITRDTLTNLPKDTPTEEYLRRIFFTYGWELAPPLAFFIVAMLFIGIMVTLIQTNFLWADEKVGLKWENVHLNPLAFFTRLASIQGMVEILKSVVKLLIVGYVAYGYLNSHTKELLQLQSLGIIFAFNQWSQLIYDLGIRVGIIYLILGIADYLFQRWNYGRSMKMSKDEVKDEMIQQEGNPIIKSAIKAKQREAAFRRMMSAVPKASVVITNPTHLAIAIEYRQEMEAPKVLAKGQRLVAERIIELAKKNNVPVVENIPLARALYSTVEVDQFIPPELYTAMAEVLIYIHRLRGTLSGLVKK